MRLLLLFALVAACSTPRYTNGALRCSPTGKACPDNFFCAADERCWIVGSGPEFGGAHALDLAAPADLAHGDLAVAQPIPDLMRPDDATVIPLVQIGAVTNGTSTFTAALPSPSRTGTLLALTVVFDAGGISTGPAGGWSRWSGNSTVSDGEVWFLPNNPGGVTSVSTTFAAAHASVGQLSEWVIGGQDEGGWCWSDSPTVFLKCPRMPSPAPTTMHAGDLGLACFAALLPAAGSVTLTPGSGWVNLGNNDGASTKLHYAFNFALSIPSGAAFTDTESSSLSATWGGAIVTLH